MLLGNRVDSTAASFALACTMATPNDEAIQMAVDYLLSADGTAPIEVQLSFLKGRMKMVRTCHFFLSFLPAPEQV